MRRLALLGASSLIARDLAERLARVEGWELALFSRQPELLLAELARRLRGDAVRRVRSLGYAGFAQGHWDVVINFVGVGTPERTRKMGASIFDVSFKYDQLALDYLDGHPDCRYIFLSSGAAYCLDFESPASADSLATVPLNAELAGSAYALAKLACECRHRARREQSIVDVRVFNYFSRHVPLDAGFLVTDAVKAILDGDALTVSPAELVRDYLHPDDFHRLVVAVIEAPAQNTPLDAYSRAPLAKRDLLRLLAREFGLRYRVDAAVAVAPTGLKPHYYSVWRKTAELGWEPAFSSQDTIRDEVGAALSAHRRDRPAAA